MSRIEELKIGPHMVSVLYVDAATINQLAEDTHVLGATEPDTYTIYILNTLSGTVLVDTLVHEALHFCYWHSGDPKGEENIVAWSATSITALMVDNPHLLAWIGLTLAQAAQSRVPS